MDNSKSSMEIKILIFISKKNQLKVEKITNLEENHLFQTEYIKIHSLFSNMFNNRHLSPISRNFKARRLSEGAQIVR